MCWHRYFRYIENRYDTLAEMYQITIWKMYVSGSLNSLSTRNLHQVIPASCLWVPVTPGRTPAWTEHGDQPGVAGYSSICLGQFRFLHQLSTWTTASSSHHLMASASRPPRDIITGQVGPKEKRADVQALRPRQAFRGRNPPEQGRLHRASLQAAEAVVTPHPPPALFRANYYIQRDIIFVVSWHWNKHWQ